MKNLNGIVLIFWLMTGAVFPLSAQLICNPDVTAPVVACSAEISAVLDAGTMTVVITTEDVVEAVMDNCTENVRLRLELHPSAGVPPADSTLTFTTPGLYTILAWAGDESENWVFCWTSILVTSPDSENKNFEGLLFADGNGNCMQDGNEPALAGLPVEAVAITASGTRRVQGLTDANGQYALEMSEVVIEAATSIEVRLGNLANNAGNCPSFSPVPVGYFDSQTTFLHDFAVNLIPGCHQLEVDLATPSLRRCFNSNYAVNYCNYGAETAENATIEVELDPFLSPTNSTLPWTSVSGNTYTFSLGDVPPGFCGTFYLNFVVGCHAVLGQTHCTAARIFPVSDCIPSYTGAEIAVDGACVDGDVIFTITNTGATDMTSPVQYYVVEDVIMFLSGDIQLNSGQSQQLSFVANGATYRVELPQVPGHPFSVLPSASVEGCGLNPDGAISLGFVTQFPQDDPAPQIDIDCRQNTGSYDPNDKQAFPRGALEDHLISANTDLEYLIRFQNTGTDTAFTVVVLDTLSEHLDIASIRPGAASHAYTFTLLEGNILKFSFNDILLPDSNVNVAASQGFVKFRVKQQPDLEAGTEIRNDAAIYFDFNEPVITNAVRQVIGTPFVMVQTETPATPPAYRTCILPNPMYTSGLIRVEGLEGQAAQFQLYHPTGALLQQLLLLNGEAALDLTLSAAGLYYFTVTANGRRLSSGKLVVGIR
ncbi:MAG: T9SS type A sorting domain-containing protein [Saprospiraceae bacterium]